MNTWGQVERRFRARLKVYRTRVKLSQEELASRAGLSRQYVQELEAGTSRSPSLQVLCALAHVLEVEVGDLVSLKAKGKV